MAQLTQQDLLDARAHLGHLASKWHPRFASFVFMKKNGIHVIDLRQTLKCLARSASAMQQIVHLGGKILFVATKKQAKEVVATTAQRLGQPYVKERWLGGTLTNFPTTRKLLKKLHDMDTHMQMPTYLHLTKKEQLVALRKKAKLERTLKGLVNIHRPPAALFVVDINKEQIAVREANKLGIPVFAIVDSNASPDLVDYPIPANDDTRSAIAIVLNYLEAKLSMTLQDRQDAKQKITLSTKDEASKGDALEKNTKPTEAATPQGA